MGNLLLGTSSWSEKSWSGVFYPSGMASGDMLAYYAKHFATVEADVTYYRIPSRGMIQGWRNKTPPGFTISAKFPQSIVHGGAGPQPDPTKLLLPTATASDTARFLEAMSELGDKCGPLVLQFPYFNRSAFSTIEPFLERLDAFLSRLPRAFRYGVEIRNRDWIGPALLDLLRQHQVGLVLVDLAYMPHPADLAQQRDVVTADFVYCRLIGDRKAIDNLTTTFDKIVLDQRPRLQRWSGLIRELLPRVRQVFLYANNHYAGHAPATIRELSTMITSAADEITSGG